MDIASMDFAEAESRVVEAMVAAVEDQIKEDLCKQYPGVTPVDVAMAIADAHVKSSYDAAVSVVPATALTVHQFLAKVALAASERQRVALAAQVSEKEDQLVRIVNMLLGVLDNPCDDMQDLQVAEEVVAMVKRLREQVKSAR